MCQYLIDTAVSISTSPPAVRARVLAVLRVATKCRGRTAIAKRLRPRVLRALVGIMLIIVGGSAVAKVLGRVF